MQRETIAELLLDRLGDHHPGLLTREHSWSWDEVVHESAVRAALAREQRTEGPFHIGVLLDNVAEFLFWLGGAALCGATVVGINPTRRGADLQRDIRHVDCQMIVTDSAGLALLDGLDVGLGHDRIILVDGNEYPTQLAAHTAAPARSPEVTAQTQMLLLFTSGSTGAAKAARCSQGRLAGLGYQNSAKYSVTREDVSYCCMPLFHGNALMALWAPSLVAGATIALTPKFSASGFLPDVRFYGATFFTYVGTAIGYLLATPQRDDDAETTLTHGFGTEASPQDRQAFRARFGARLYDGYGSSETAGMITPSPDKRPEALGQPAHEGVAIVNATTLGECPTAILDGHGRVTNAEEAVGELVDKAGAAKFEGYYKNEEADAQRVHNGWFWTGDLGYRDSSGFLYFAGRSGDWMRVDGENISAVLIERILYRHEGIVAAGVFGVPDPRAGDQVMAALQLPAGVSFDDLDLAGFLREQGDLPTKGAPRYVRVSSLLPTTGSNKLRKKEMQVRAWRTEDEVYWWAGRGEPSYALMTERDGEELQAQFHANGRQRFAP